MALLNPESSQAIQDSKFLFAQPLVDDQVGKAIREALGFADGFCGRLSAKVWRSSTQSPAFASGGNAANHRPSAVECL